MQFKLAAFTTIAAMATLAAATPTPNGGGDTNQCNSGSLQCCDSTQDSQSLSTLLSGLLTSLHVDLGTLTGLVGVTCSPITGVGASGTSCSQQSVCCTNDSFNGVVALGCTPINLNV